MQSPAPTATASTKQSPTSSQINIKSSIEGLFTSVPNTEINTRHANRQGKKYKMKQTEEIKHSSDPDSDVTHILKLSNREYKIPITSMLRALTEKVDNAQEQMSNISREIETLRKNKKEMLEIKNTVTEMRNTFYGLISRLDTAKERIIELEDTAIETLQIAIQREKNGKKMKHDTTNCGTISKAITCA